MEETTMLVLDPGVDAQEIAAEIGTCCAKGQAATSL
jgi:hypothetical protein